MKHFETQNDCFELFGMRLNNETLCGAAKRVLNTRKDSATTFCFVNVNTVNLAEKHPTLRSDVNGIDIAFADGAGMRIAADHIGVRLRGNVNGTDLMPLICEGTVKQGKSIYLLGGEPGVSSIASEKLKQANPKLNICGHSHGFFDKTQSQEIIQHINNAGTDILLVSFGSPIQERWISEHRHLLKVDSILAVGGLLDFCAEKFSRAPLWMREYGLEWVWRLLQEPRNKFYRYVIGNPVFLWRCARELKRPVNEV